MQHFHGVLLIFQKLPPPSSPTISILRLKIVAENELGKMCVNSEKISLRQDDHFRRCIYDLNFSCEIKSLSDFPDFPCIGRPLIILVGVRMTFLFQLANNISVRKAFPLKKDF